MDKRNRDTPDSPASALGLVATPILVREQAFDQLRGAIINGQFPPGTRLIERELCEAMGVSRTSIREVLRRLEAEHLIRVEPRKGPTVAHLTRSQAGEIYGIRGYLEGVLVRRFIERASDAEIVTLSAISERFAQAVADADVPQAVAIMVEFYSHLSAVAQTQVVNDILNQLTARVSYLRRTTMSQPGRMEKSAAEIAEIVDAVRKRDATAAHKAVVKHIKAAAHVALARLAD